MNFFTFTLAPNQTKCLPLCNLLTSPITWLNVIHLGYSTTSSLTISKNKPTFSEPYFPWCKTALFPGSWSLFWGIKTSWFQENPCKRQDLMKRRNRKKCLHSRPKKPRSLSPTLPDIWLEPACVTVFQHTSPSCLKLQLWVHHAGRTIPRHPSEVDFASSSAHHQQVLFLCFCGRSSFQYYFLQNSSPLYLGHFPTSGTGKTDYKHLIA